MELNYKEIVDTYKSISKEIDRLEFVIGRTHIIDNLRNYTSYWLNLLYCDGIRKELI